MAGVSVRGRPKVEPEVAGCRICPPGPLQEPGRRPITVSWCGEGRAGIFPRSAGRGMQDSNPGGAHMLDEEQEAPADDAVDVADAGGDDAVDLADLGGEVETADEPAVTAEELME